MTGKCIAQLPTDFGVTRSRSRPQVSDDNPFSEFDFKTLKYHLGFPGRFTDIAAATGSCRTFFRRYNDEHGHGGIATLAPADVHHGRTEAMIAQWEPTFQQAWAKHRVRFVHGKSKPQPLSHKAISVPRRRPDEMQASRVPINCDDRLLQFPFLGEPLACPILPDDNSLHQQNLDVWRRFGDHLTEEASLASVCPKVVGLEDPRVVVR